MGFHVEVWDFSVSHSGWICAFMHSYLHTVQRWDGFMHSSKEATLIDPSSPVEILLTNSYKMRLGTSETMCCYYDRFCSLSMHVHYLTSQ